MHSQVEDTKQDKNEKEEVSTNAELPEPKFKWLGKEDFGGLPVIELDDDELNAIKRISQFPEEVFLDPFDEIEQSLPDAGLREYQWPNRAKSLLCDLDNVPKGMHSDTWDIVKGMVFHPLTFGINQKLVSLLGCDAIKHKYAIHFNPL